MKTYKYRIYPKKSQIGKLKNTFSMCRPLYNWSLAEKETAYHIRKYSKAIETSLLSGKKKSIFSSCFGQLLFPAKQEATAVGVLTGIEGIFGITFSSVWEVFPRNVNYYDQAGKLPSLKKESPWFKSVHSQVLQDTLKRLDKAYQNFYRRVREGKEKAGYPKYKKKGQWDSITYPQYSEFPEDNIIKVSKIGKIKIRYHREIPIIGTIKTLTIEEDGGKWFACKSFKFPPKMIELKQDLSRAVGLDAGLNDFYYASDGSHIEVPKYFRKAEKKLKRVQEKFSELEAKYKGKKKPKKFYKLLKVLQKLHYRVRCQREDFLHKQANRLLAEFDIIIHEDLNIQGMKRRPKPKQDEDGKYLPNRASQKAGLNKSISDVAWGKFFQILKYKAKRRGKTVIAVPPQYTSQICSG